MDMLGLICCLSCLVFLWWRSCAVWASHGHGLHKTFFSVSSSGCPAAHGDGVKPGMCADRVQPRE
jgi:hypothetical protein